MYDDMRIALLLLASLALHAQDVPVLAELFTSEGCSSCPPADQLLQALDRTQPVAGARVIVLGEHVDYWDRLGWRDPFSSPLFSARQERYARLLGAEVYTPQIVIDGREAVLGNDPEKVRQSIERAAKRQKATLTVAVRRDTPDPAITVSGNARGELWIAVAAESARSDVTRGENSGRALTHVSVVRSLLKAGKMDSPEKSLRIPIRPEASRVIAFVVDGTAVKAAAMALLP
jgi:hypothetical protein